MAAETWSVIGFFDQHLSRRTVDRATAYGPLWAESVRRAGNAELVVALATTAAATLGNPVPDEFGVDVFVRYAGNKPKGQINRATTLRRGADAASGDWLLFLDTDVILPPCWLDEAKAWAARTGAKAFLGFSRMFMLREDETNKLLSLSNPLAAVDKLDSLYGGKDLPVEMGPREETRFEVPDYGERSHVNGALAIRADLFWKAGGYDSRVSFGREDVELCYRLRKAMGIDPIAERMPGSLWRLYGFTVGAKPDTYKKRLGNVAGWYESERIFKYIQDNPDGMTRALRRAAEIKPNDDATP